MTKRNWLATLCALVAVAALAPAAAHADFGIQSLTTTVTSAQAGGHPDSITDVQFKLTPDGQDVDGRMKDLVVTLPPGFLGSPLAAPECPMAVFEANFGRCAPGSQVGVLTLDFMSSPGSVFPQELPVYRVTAQPGHAATFAALALIPTVTINADIGPDGGYRLTTTISDASLGIPLAGSRLVFWGVPADPSHDAQRTDVTGTTGVPAGVNPKPFMIYPSDCTVSSLTTTAKADSWEDPGNFQTTTAEMTLDPSVDPSTPPAVPTGCDKLSIAPWLRVTPTDAQADSPSGYQVEVHVPQNDDAGGLATPPLKRIVVTLPSGVSLSPGQADGLSACTDAELGASSNAPAACPDAAKIGSVEIDTPLQADPLRGSVYLGSPQAGNPYRLFIVASGPGTLIKLVGRANADPGTGQLTTVFDDNPQLPFSSLTLRFFGGSRAALANPLGCGTMGATSQLDSWSGATASPGASFDIVGCGSPLPFAPGLVAGTTDNHAGSSGSFTLQVSRPDRQQNLATVDADLPPGLTADVASVPFCPDAQAAAGTCPDSSQVGTVNVASGAGGQPFWLRGKAFLTGPYKGAPFGFAMVVPAQAGPFDLGTVVVRAAVSVDPGDAHLHVVTDPLPQILQGIPLRLRAVAVTIDRPDFMLNPSSCDRLAVRALIGSVQGASAHLSTPFQVRGCSGLRFAPHLFAKFTGGRGSARRGGHPGLSLRLTQAAGQADSRLISVMLPPSIALNSARGSALCPRDQWTAGNCPASSRVGSAKAVTRILAKPLSGPVYLVAPAGAGLPTLGVVLAGQVRITLEGHTAFSHSRLRTTFPAVPDVPVSSFALTLSGGANGLLTPTSDLCSRRQTASARTVGQNGARHSSRLHVVTTCSKQRKKR